MKPARLFIVCALLAASIPAMAQYQWIDKDGRRVAILLPGEPGYDEATLQ